MERENIEIKRFIDKAEGYIKGLSLAPYARIFEIVAILNVINDFVSKSDIPKSKIRIVELMAGSGYLTKFLSLNGFKHLHVFEISSNMASNITNQNHNYHFHPISDLSEIETPLKEINPHIVVSLAGYHHLIEYSSGENIDIAKSVDFQRKVTELSIKYTAKNHLVLIADIFDTELLKEVQIEPVYWNKKALKFIPSNLISKKTISELKKTTDLKSYSETLKRNFSNPISPKNSTIKWFRDLVDNYSLPGHKDVALSKNFISTINSNYSVNYSTFYTPWLFKNKTQLNEFIHSFWFSELKPGKSESDINNYLEKNHLIKTMDDGTFTFNWELAIITVQKKDCIKVSNFFRKGIFYSIILIVLLILAILVKKYTKFFDFTFVLDKVIWINYGVILKDILYEKIKTLWLT